MRRTTVQDGAVYTYVGSENIYQPIAPFPMEIDPITGTPDQAGPRELARGQSSIGGGHAGPDSLAWTHSTFAGGRFDSLRDHNYSGTTPSGAVNFTDRTVWLPQYAVTFNPRRISPSTATTECCFRWDHKRRSGPVDQFPTSIYYSPGGDWRKVRARPTHSAHYGALSHARAVLLPQEDSDPTFAASTGRFVLRSEGRETHDGD